MLHKMIEIAAPEWEEKGKLYTYFLDSSPEMHPDERRPLVLVCPGGGYEFTSDREAEPIVIQYLSMGFHAAVLRYSVAPARFPVALCQLAGAVCYLKQHAEEYHIDPDKIYVQGFSAGGHLTASLGVFWNRPFLKEALGMENEMFRPAGLILAYPVIKSGEFAHEGSFRNLLGDRYDAKADEMSLEKQVTKDTPPTFLWHTAEDTVVPVENSVLFFMALKNAGVPAELHIYPYGPHGLALANHETDNPAGVMVQEACQSWIRLVETWLKNM